MSNLLDLIEAFAAIPNVDRKQAEIIATRMLEAVDSSAATKSDLRMLGADLRDDLRRLERHLYAIIVAAGGLYTTILFFLLYGRSH